MDIGMALLAVLLSSVFLLIYLFVIIVVIITICSLLYINYLFCVLQTILGFQV